jgi:hypothetical protein
MKSSTNTLNSLVLSSESPTNATIQVGVTPRNAHVARQGKNVQNAIYAYIRAIRALGRDTVNTIEIAEALSLTVPEVNRAIAALEKRGVKILNG